MRIQVIRNDLFNQQTEYGNIRVTIAMVDEDPVYLLMIDGGAESARYLEAGRERELVFDYLQRLSYAFVVNPDIRHTFMIGGGGFNYPQYYVNAYPDADITVAEISKEVIAVAYQYFGLKDLQEEEAKRIHVLHQDGIAWLKDHEEKYDLIINDAFIGTNMEVRDTESTKIIHDHLLENGIYVVNVLSCVTGKGAEPSERIHAILQEHFKYTAIMVVDDELDPDSFQNILLFASDSELL